MPLSVALRRKISAHCLAIELNKSRTSFHAAKKKGGHKAPPFTQITRSILQRDTGNSAV
jgi:hypothetical protein